MHGDNTTALSQDRPGPVLLWALRLGALFTAAMALWRLLLYAGSLISGARLPVQEAALTFMWIPDLLFLLVFLYLAWRAPELQSRCYRETGLIVAGLQSAFLLATMIVFRRWTDAAALGFDDPLTWLHIILPSLWCAWFFLFLLWQIWRGGHQGGKAANDCAAPASAESSEKSGLRSL